MKPEPTDDAWDICADFLEPLAKMLSDWSLRRLFGGHGVLYAAYITRISTTTTATFAGNCGKAFHDFTFDHDASLVRVWLEVNVSCEIADRVMKLLADAERTVDADSKVGKWPDTGTTGRYFGNLARVLRQKRGEEISKSEIRKQAEETPATTPPISKTTLGEIFVCHRNQVDDKVLAKYQHVPDGTKYRMLVKDMPAGWETIVAKHGAKPRNANRKPKT